LSIQILSRVQRFEGDRGRSFGWECKEMISRRERFKWRWIWEMREKAKDKMKSPFSLEVPWSV
jgi:hypothetical protein